jgi:hypothetical protein
MKDYTPSDLPRLMVERIKRIPNPLRHNRQLVGVTAFSERFILHTWYCPWDSYSARIPDTERVSNQYQSLIVEEIYSNSFAQST